MSKDLYRIDISNFILNIIENDAQNFKFIKKDNTSNISGYLNRLFPNMLKIRKLRREIMENELNIIFELANKAVMDRTKKYLSTVLDKVYFINEESEDLDEQIWVRVKKHLIPIFDEIDEEEKVIAQLTTSELLRSFLNEYCRLPQYKREQIIFYDELNIIFDVIRTGKVINLEYNGEKYSVIVNDHIIKYLNEQANYISCYDIINKQYLYCNLTYIKKIYKSSRKFEYTEEITNKFQYIVDNENELKEFIVEFRGDNNV